MAIVGRTGSGKSTVAQLLLRMYDVAEGKIELDNINIQQIDLKMLREQISYVPQDVFLFSETVAVFALSSLAQILLHTTWVLYTTFRFGWGPLENGVSLFAVGVTAAVVQAGLLLKGRQNKQVLKRRLQHFLISTKR